MASMKYTGILLSLLLMTSCASASSLLTRDEATWVQQVEQQAIATGISPAVVYGALDGFVPDPRVVELDQRQPEGSVSFETYRRNTITQARVRKGSELMHLHGGQLAALEQETGVPPSIVVALWGIESSFGQNMGGFETVNALATLAYEGRRAEFFRGELFKALKILEQENMPASALRGSWAGAMGQCQFMPSTYLKFAVDGDGDGRRDIWNDNADALASIAHYLAAEGWKGDLSWGREVEASDISASAVGLTQTKTLAQWGAMGVANVDGSPLPARDLRASLLRPDGAVGRAYLVYDNTRALMRWNKSSYFALSVGSLADEIKRY